MLSLFKDNLKSKYWFSYVEYSMNVTEINLEILELCFGKSSSIDGRVPKHNFRISCFM